MANYKKISGQAVKCYDSDPPRAYPSAWEGQLYYNTSDGQFKYQTLGAGAWSSGGNLNTANRYLPGDGTSTAAYVVGGNDPVTAIHEQYNGSSWTEVADLNTARRALGSFGTQTSALAYGGSNDPGDVLNISESWNGSAWTEVGDLNTPRTGLQGGGAGTSNTTGLLAGCFSYSGGVGSKTFVESWDGSSWTEIADINTARESLGLDGTVTAAIAVGGTPSVALSETWNGSSWTEGGDLNTGRNGVGFTSNDGTEGIVFGGTEPPGSFSVKTETYNGTSYTEGSDLGTARSKMGSSGTGGTSALASGGDTPGATASTEEWALSHTLKKVTTS